MNILVTRKLPSSVIAKLEAVGDVDVYTGDGGDSARRAARARRRQATRSSRMLTEQVDGACSTPAPTLKIVANVAVGYNNIDVPAARARGVVVTNTPDVLTESVADFTWALILAITRRLSEGERLVRRGEWKGWAFDFMLGTELRGKQLGLVGFGRIARAVAARAPAFGMRVAYTSRRDIGSAGAERDVARSAAEHVRHRVAARAADAGDAAPDRPERALARMKRSAYLINTSRGPVVDEAALAWALQQRLIAGAALDVYEHEPASIPDLLPLENVLLVPHLGSATTETRTAMADLAVRQRRARSSAARPPLRPFA